MQLQTEIIIVSKLDINCQSFRRSITLLSQTREICNFQRIPCKAYVSEFDENQSNTRLKLCYRKALFYQHRIVSESVWDRNEQIEDTENYT